MAGFYHYLLNYDLEGFNEATKPLANQAKNDLIDLCEFPATKFLRAWAAGDLPIPFTTCSADDLYSAFRLWLEWTGEGWAKISKDRVSKEVSRMISRGVLSLEKERKRDESGQLTRIYRKGHEPFANTFEQALDEFRKMVRRDRAGPP